MAVRVRVGSEDEMVDEGVYSTRVGWCTSYNYGLKGGILIIHQLLGSFAVQLMDDNLLHRQSIVNWF
jgi:hypothetical protein